MLNLGYEWTINLATKRWLRGFAETAPLYPIAGVLGFFAIFYLLDWASFIEPFGPFGITPWNPQTGFAIAVLLVRGRPVVPLLLVAPFFADLLSRASAVPTTASLLVSLASGGLYAVYYGQVYARLVQDVVPRDLRGLSTFLLLTVIASATVAALSVAIFASFGLLPWSQYLVAFVRLWIGDLVGITVFTTASTVLLTGDHRVTIDLEAIGLAAVLMCCVGFVLISAPVADFRYFYILFLPVVWIAARYGYEAVLASLVAVQVVVATVIQFENLWEIHVTTLQGLLLILSVTGMIAGMLVTQSRRFAQSVRLQQELHAKLNQMGSLGEFATLVAHEVNQPLMAAGTYTQLAIEKLSASSRDEATLEVAKKAQQQIARAAEVVRRLRELVDTGRLERSSVEIAAILDQAVTLMDAELDHAAGIHCEVRVSPGLPAVHVDRIQIEQVLLNLIRNSLEAFQMAERTQGQIVVSATQGATEQLVVCVEDDGPGIDASSFGAGSTLRSSKPRGLGIGLALSRSIVEAHGGSFTVEGNSAGTRVCFTLPRAGTSHADL